MQPLPDISLKKYNTFGIDVTASHFAPFSDAETLAGLLEFDKTLPLLILGGGSNLLFKGNFNGLVLKNEVPGIELVAENNLHVFVKVGAGENWNGFVNHCLAHNWAGVENLSLIPGNAGAAPMQNIGAYGVEIKDVFEELQAYHLHDRKTYTLSANDCAFGYRESVFKKQYKGQFVILNITLRLDKIPRLHTSYGVIEQELGKMKVAQPTIQTVAQAVVNIRRSKLPDPAQIGNAGSFFKNPSISNSQFETLKHQFSSMPGFHNSDGSIKVPAAWLIEQCGWKGYRKGDAGCHAMQPLVLVNYGNATGAAIYELSEDILESVRKKFGIHLEREVNIIG